MTVEQAITAAVVLLVVSTVVPASAATQETATPTSTSCATTVVHDAFRFDNATIQAANNGSASSTVKNTQAVLEENDVFVRLTAENPNGYCVEFDVQLGPEVVPSSELGSLQSIDGNVSAEWHAVRDFDRDETYTRVTFTLAPGESAVFAPNKARIMQLEWLADAKTESDGIIPTIGSYWPGEDDDLNKRTYTFGPDQHGSSIITVPLRDQRTDRRIENWQAVYRVDGGRWQPIKTEAGAAVYYQETDDHVQFYFNDQDAEVEFTANPDSLEKAKQEYREYTAGWSRLGGLIGGDSDLWPFGYIGGVTEAA